MVIYRKNLLVLIPQVTIPNYQQYLLWLLLLPLLPRKLVQLLYLMIHLSTLLALLLTNITLTFVALTHAAFFFCCWWNVTHWSVGSNTLERGRCFRVDEHGGKRAAMAFVCFWGGLFILLQSFEAWDINFWKQNKKHDTNINAQPHIHYCIVCLRAWLSKM